MSLGRDEFDKLALEHLDMLYRIARRLTREPAAAEDLVQETYLRAFRARDEFKLQEYGIRPWLVRIMHNLHLTRVQRDKRQPVAFDEIHMEGAEAQTDSPWSGNAADYQAMDEQLVRAIEDLPEEYRTVLLLWAIEDFTYKEIAAATNVPIGTVMSRLYRARTKLSERLREFVRKERIIRE